MPVKATYLFPLTLILMTSLAAGGVDVQKIRLKGTQYSKDLKYFQETGLIAARNTAIEMQIEAFERSLISYREAKNTDRNLALKNAQQTYEKFQGEFKAIAEIYRDLVDKHQSRYNERSGEAFADTDTKEKTLATVEVGKQDEGRGLSAYNNRNYAYSAHCYLSSLKHYNKAFELRKWPQLIKLPEQYKGKSAKAKKTEKAKAPVLK